MLTPKVTTPALSPRFVPETLLDLLKPGKVFTAKVETLAGRLLTLWVGGERLEALLSDAVSSSLFKPGQRIKLKVADLGPPLLLSVLFEEQSERPEKVFPRLLQKFVLQKKNLSADEPLRVLSREPSPKEPALEKALFELFHDENMPLKQELRETLLRLWNEGQFLVPFFWGERILWSYLYERESRERQAGDSRYFVLEVFLERLGFLSAHFRLLKDFLELSLRFAREESRALAHKELPFLEEALGRLNRRVVIKCETLGVPPGILLTKEA